jgi:hypothetical protein
LASPARFKRLERLERFYFMKLKYGLISVDDHVQEPPDLWTNRLSKSRWGDRIPHLERAGGTERWIVDGEVLLEAAPRGRRR